MCILRKVFPLDQFLYPSSYYSQKFWHSIPATRVPMQSKKYIKVWMLLRIRNKICYSIGFHQVNLVAILNRSWSLVFIIYSWPAFLVFGQKRYMVVRALSGSEKFIMIRCKYVTCVADRNPWPDSLIKWVLNSLISVTSVPLLMNIM